MMDVDGLRTVRCFRWRCVVRLVRSLFADQNIERSALRATVPEAVRETLKAAPFAGEFTLPTLDFQALSDTKEDLLKLLRALFSRNLSGGFALSLVPILRGFEGSDVLNTLLEEPTETYSWVCQVALAHPHRTP